MLAIFYTKTRTRSDSVLIVRQDDDESCEASGFYTAGGFGCLVVCWNFIGPVDTGSFKRRCEGTCETNGVYEQFEESGFSCH